MRVSPGVITYPYQRLEDPFVKPERNLSSGYKAVPEWSPCGLLPPILGNNEETRTP